MEFDEWLNRVEGLGLGEIEVDQFEIMYIEIDKVIPIPFIDDERIAYICSKGEERNNQSNLRIKAKIEENIKELKK